MPDIRYVCLSDMHFGAETSLLTNLRTASSDIDPQKPSPVLESLVECLRYLIAHNENKAAKPILILNGDILELALANTNMAAMAFERFIDLILPPGDKLFDRILYNPGNHDHHLWETARETQYVEFFSGIGWGQLLPAPWHTTKIFSKPVPSYFLTRLIRRLSHLSMNSIEMAYPNFGVLSEDKRKCVVFHHGHFIEWTYMLMSVLKTLLFPQSEIPGDVWDREAENFAWIDFFWSALGRSADVGKGVGSVYEKLRDEKQVKKLLKNLADGLAKRYDLPGWGDLMEAKLLEVAFNLAADSIRGLERRKIDRVLSEDAEKGLWEYMEVPLRKQILGECQNTMPFEVTFVFGHTHKPFQEDMNFDGYPEWVNVYNTGGWVVDSVEPQPLHGAAVVLIDENLEAASLRLYNEATDPRNYRVSVQQARHPGDKPGTFYERIQELVNQDPTPWTAFSESVARAINVRAQNLRARINRPI